MEGWGLTITVTGTGTGLDGPPDTRGQPAVRDYATLVQCIFLVIFGFHEMLLFLGEHWRTCCFWLLKILLGRLRMPRFFGEETIGEFRLFDLGNLGKWKERRIFLDCVRVQ